MNHQRKDCMGRSCRCSLSNACPYHCGGNHANTFVLLNLLFFFFFLIHREIKFITRKNQLFLFHVFHLHSLCSGNREVEKRRTRQTRSSGLSRVCRPLRAQPWHSEVWSPFLLPQTWTLMPELLMQGTMTLISIF